MILIIVGNKRAFGVLEEDEDVVFGSKKVTLNIYI